MTIEAHVGAHSVDTEPDPTVKLVAYRALIARIRQSVPNLVPVGSRVLVVSRGDDELLRLAGVKAGHYPQAGDGRYAGHYPADSEAAVAHLEALRSDGAQFVLFPQPAAWWLEHYDGLASHLAEHHRELYRDDDLVLFELAGARAETPPPASSSIVDAQWAQLAGMLDAILPRDESIVLISQAELAPLLRGRSVLQVTPSATESQTSDVSGRPLSLALRDAIRSGSKYVVIPRFGDPATIEGILSAVGSRYRLLLDQERVCAVFEASPVGRATIHQLRGSSPTPASSPKKGGGRRAQA